MSIQSPLSSTSARRRGAVFVGLFAALTMLSACGSSADDEGSPRATADTSATARPSGDGPSRSPGTTGGAEQGQNAPQTFETPSANGKTPALRYAWCLREAGLPAVVIGDDVAFEGDGSSTTEQGTTPQQAQIESDCQKKTPDYTAPNYNQR